MRRATYDRAVPEWGRGPLCFSGRINLDSILITGGTGSLGQALARYLLTLPISRLAILSRDEWKQAQQAATLTDPRVRWFLGDVRDRPRLEQAFMGVDCVIHAAALKRVDAIAHDPAEVKKTNIDGTENVIWAAMRASVAKVMLISSDKAVQPTNFYGTTKMAAEWLAVMGNTYTYPQGTRCAVVRYGNVLGSRGSVLGLWRDCIAAGKPIPITDPTCSRFWITMDQAVRFVWRAMERMEGGEIFLPELRGSRLPVLAEALAPGYPTELVGLRPGGEKLHESLVNPEEATRAAAHKDGFTIAPSLTPWRPAVPLSHWGDPLPQDWVYQSDIVGQLTVPELRAMLE